MRFRHRPVQIGLAAQLAIAFFVMTLAVGAFLYVAVKSYADRTIRTSSVALMSRARSDVFSKIDSELRLAEGVVAYNAAIARTGMVPLDDEVRLGRFLHDQISFGGTIDYLFFANERGGMVSAGFQYGKHLLFSTPGLKSGDMVVDRVDSSGKVVAREKTVPNMDARKRVWYESAKNKNRLIWTEPYAGTATAPLAISTAHPLIAPSGELQGVFGADLLLDELGTFLESNRISPGAYAMLIEPDGSLVANTSKAPLFAERGGEVIRLKAEETSLPFAGQATDFVRRAHASGELEPFSALLHDEDDRAYYLDISLYSHADDIRWYLVMVAPRSDFTGPLDALWMRFVLILLGGAAGAFGLSRTMAWWVTQPMRAINARVKQIAEGNFGNRVESRRNDEVGELVQSFNDMSGRLASTYEEIRQKNLALDAANQDLASLLERERVRRLEAEAEGRRANLLGEATALFSAAQDYDRVLDDLTLTLARSFVDWVLLDIAAPGRPTQSVASHRDIEKEPLLRELAEKCPHGIRRSAPVLSAIRSGAPLHLPALSDEQVRAFSGDDCPVELLRQLGTRSALIVPLVARDTHLGTLTLVAASPNRFDPADVELAAELGRRTAMALDNARLYSDLQRENAERRQAEAARGETRELLQSIVDNSPALIYVKDLEGRYLLVNRHMTEVMGHGARALIGKTVFDVLPREQANALAAFDQRVLAAGEALEGEEDVARADGVHTYLSIKAPLWDASGRAYALCGISTEITARKRAEAALRRTEEQLRQAQKMEAIGNLAGGIAHDFNNLLSVILSYSSLISEGLDPSDPRRADAEEIERAAECAAALTHQLLAFSRKQILQPKIIKLSDIVCRLEPMLRRLIGEHIELTVLVGQELGFVKADPSQMEQVIMNLAVNARDAMPRAGKLIIETSNVHLSEEYAAAHVGVVPGPYVRLAVTDTGVGMDQATQARMFEPFFTTKEKGRGTGLGLATVFGIVQQSGGSIWVYSELGKGTVFKVYFPRTDADAAAAAASLHPPVGSLTGQETILLVEDEERVRVLVRTILRRRGYQVIEAQTAGDALLVCEERSATIDLLLTDVVMPRISGPELAERLSRHRPNMKILYMSGHTENAIVHQGTLDSAVAFLQKPITPEGLARKVREVLDAPQPAFR
jgi:two-component system, cell cycle sensor histidine kinase and response regulator CckA